jgi:hypothetical protein
MIIHGFSESVKELFRHQIFKKPKLVQLDKVLYKWFTAMHSEGKLMTGPMIIEKATYFYDYVKITGKCTCTFYEGRTKKLPVRT